MRHYKEPVKVKKKEIPMNTRIITVNKEVRIPNTDIILEKGDQIKVFSEIINKKREKIGKKVIKENSIWKDKIASAEGAILFGNESYKMDKYGGFKNQPKPDDVLDIFSDYMKIENWFSSNNLDYFVEETGIDLNYDYPSPIIDELSDAGIVSNKIITDNTYNWSWLGPWDIVFSTAKSKLKNEYITIFAIHEGGDVRSNYGPNYVYTSNYEFGFVEELDAISASINISFKDRGSIVAYSQQDSDIWYFEVEIDDYSELADQFLEYCETIGQGSELDDFLTSFLR